MDKFLDGFFFAVAPLFDPVFWGIACGLLVFLMFGIFILFLIECAPPPKEE